MFFTNFFRGANLILLLSATSVLCTPASAVNSTTGTNVTASSASSDAIPQLETGFYRISFLDQSVPHAPPFSRPLGAGSDDRVVVLPSRIAPQTWHVVRHSLLAYSISTTDGRSATIGKDNSVQVIKQNETQNAIWTFQKAPRPPGYEQDNNFIIGTVIVANRRRDWEVSITNRFIPGEIPIVIGEAGTILQVTKVG